MLLPALLLWVAVATGAPSKDEITHLPGWEGPLPSRMYSGYIDAGSDTVGGTTYTMHEHYFFVESEGDPLKDPVLVWTNGGPGASSMFGLFVELGPFYLDGESRKTAAYNATGVPSLFRNQYSWTKLANVLIINSPPPVGYSYCDPAGPSGKGTSCGDWNDSRTAVHNSIYLNNWLTAFPEFASNDWYIVGESYAGVYVPTLVRELLKGPTKVGKQLKGFAVGDGCVGTDVLCGNRASGPWFDVKFLGGHGQFSDKLYDDIMNEDGPCTHEMLKNGLLPMSAGCKKLLDQMDREVGGFYAYNLYDNCWYQNSLNPHQGWKSSRERTYWGPPGPTAAKLGAALNDYPCGGPGAMFEWVQTKDVKKALHVADDAYFFSGDNGVGFTYHTTEKNLMPFYRHVASETDLRVLVYNGDTDPGINSLVSQNWTTHLGLKEKEGWRPWTLDGKQYMGGYVTRYEGDFDFLTIRGSGHMVPEFKPKVALSFLRDWLANRPYPKYKAQ